MTSALLIGRNRVTALMTSAYLLEEAMSSKDDVSSKLQYIQQSTRSTRAGSAMMKSGVMSAISRELSATSSWYLKLAIAKRCRLDK
ncbi:DNA/RNA-binding protein translin/TB-RBP-like protein [Dorcoceras hygrometricum]|uniref:DNA/RNA-binding protein translin/TB-RBP-like protein n=1 Tax=Dorcoceras hygrometricum TaxID=472368 RepID=A0A2Z7AR02_9LAMI|nr:DNA/RNA-binding protein translin/TB-RBP-like protein [Dorcoceras hygrometricum]